MISIDQIISLYPPSLQRFPRAILREYLQVKILSIISQHRIHHQVCFIGGTALRLMYHSQRFSEDLDFDNWDLTINDFEILAKHIRQMMEYEGFTVEIKIISKGAFHCEIKIPNLLYDNNLASMASEKLVIKIDTTPQGFSYIPDISILQKFEYTTTLRTVPKDILMSMKRRAFFGRIKGRDLFDLVYLIGLGVSPHRGYCEAMMNIPNPAILKQRISERLGDFDLHALHRDVSPFLFDPSNQSVILFPQIIDQTTFL